MIAVRPLLCATIARRPTQQPPRGRSFHVTSAPNRGPAVLRHQTKAPPSKQVEAAWMSYLDTCRTVRELDGNALNGPELQRYVEAERWAWNRLEDELKAA